VIGVTVLLRKTTHAVHHIVYTWLSGIYFLFYVVRHLIVSVLSDRIASLVVVLVVLTVTTFISS